MPLSHKIKEIMESGIIGQPQILQASLCYNMKHKQRIFLPELAGGALLDVGVYALNFARMYFGTEIVRQVSNCVLCRNASHSPMPTARWPTSSREHSVSTTAVAS